MTSDPGWQRGLREAGPYLHIGIQLAATMLVWVGLGWLADRWLETTPVFLVIGGLLGMIAFFVQVIRLSKELSAKQKKSGESSSRRAKDDPNRV